MKKIYKGIIKYDPSRYGWYGPGGYYLKCKKGVKIILGDGGIFSENEGKKVKIVIDE